MSKTKYYRHQCLSALRCYQTRGAKKKKANYEDHVTNACRLLGVIRLSAAKTALSINLCHQCLSALRCYQTIVKVAHLNWEHQSHQCLSALGFCQTYHLLGGSHHSGRRSHQCLSALGFCQTIGIEVIRLANAGVTNACRLLGFVRLTKRLTVL